MIWNGSWIEITTRELTDEEREEYPGFSFIFDCKIPEDGQEVLVSDGKYVWLDVFWNGGTDGCGFEGNYDIGEGMAWMPLPPPHKCD